jgi:hypothetical protein
MPATSIAQRRLFAVAEHHPEQLREKSKSLLKMSKEQLHDFVATPEKDLPKRSLAKGK